jgi:hypothetical protein
VFGIGWFLLGDICLKCFGCSELRGLAGGRYCAVGHYEQMLFSGRILVRRVVTLAAHLSAPARVLNTAQHRHSPLTSCNTVKEIGGFGESHRHSCGLSGVSGCTSLMSP